MEELVERTEHSEMEMYDLDEYAGTVETVWFTPDKSLPNKKIRLDLKMQALKSSDLNSIQRRWNKRRMADQETAFLQEKLERHNVPRELGRLQRRLQQIRDSDFETPDEADDARSKIDQEMEAIKGDWEAEHQEIKKQLDALVDQPTIYQMLRAEVFCKVIDDHSIAWRGMKLDFQNAMPIDEPPDLFITDLYQFILDHLQRGKASRRNGGSRK